MIFGIEFLLYPLTIFINEEYPLFKIKINNRK